MRAEVKFIEANDVPNWPDWEPVSARDECQWFTVTVGSSESRAGDLFQVCVATARGIKERRLREKFVGLVVPTFEPTIVENVIREFVVAVEGPSWEVIATELGKLGRWEYDGYRE
jgi:hypothetical protein